ncbi:hypothetical protein O1611_g10650 [Lasiodiplodia mahajangana]|uniref:Uncharacterized protein n=1 Tax=Lasiodiplodia mahajangana TaxID=1108764 RepID=A0ACC2IVR1_9PEZI|nr:hypothetical protein O1611_g10650 [Lasiodiplodia mahajangana]
MASTLAKVDTSVIGQAKMAGFTDSIPTQGPSANRFGESGRNEVHETASQTSGGSGLDRRLTPTQPSNAAVIPLGRSKSQLTMLLGRDAEKKPRR